MTNVQRNIRIGLIVVFVQTLVLMKGIHLWQTGKTMLSVYLLVAGFLAGLALMGLELLIRTELNLKRDKVLLTLKRKSKGEDWITSLGWFIPRKYRNDIIGDILEDCAEMREIGCTEERIKFHVVYQWLIAVITLVPTAIKTSITDILKQVISPPR